jgi:catechol 2,3-dioxygenase-like lactoylglutathione lyase family enzyme
MRSFTSQTLIEYDPDDKANLCCMTLPPRIFESVLSVEDLAAAVGFYHGALGLEVITRNEVLVAFRCAGSVLLIFNPRLSSRSGRGVPAHGTSGAGRVAFAASDAELEQWRERLIAAGIPIEAEVVWPQGGRSIYFRDPANNVIEFAPLTLWGGGW